MTHEELLKRLNDQIEGSKAIGCECPACDNALALLAVVELHKPTKQRSVEPLCDVCEHYWAWPCPTIQAIGKELM